MLQQQRRVNRRLNHLTQVHASVQERTKGDSLQEHRIFISRVELEVDHKIYMNILLIRRRSPLLWALPQVHAITRASSLAIIKGIWLCTC